MGKVRILWVAPDLPVSWVRHAGGQTFNYYFKAFQNDDRFQVRLIALSDVENDEKIEKELHGIEHEIIYYRKVSKWKKWVNLESKYNVWNRHANLISNYCCREILKKAKDYAKQGYMPDVIVMEWTQIVVLAKEMHQIFPNSKLVASEHDVTFIGYNRRRKCYSGWRKHIWNLKYKNEKKVELKALELCDFILTHNADNKNVLIECGMSEKKVSGLVPYFNDMSMYERESNKRDVLFFGAMSRPENYLSVHWFIENVLPKLNDLDIRFVILGGNPPEFLKNMECERIHVTGFVEHVEPFFQNSMCLVAPLVLGAGIKVKVLEALSSGIPVLTNQIGIEGIPAVNGKDYVYCTRPEEYADVIRQLYHGLIDEVSLSENARNLMKYHFSIEDSLKQYKEQVGNLLSI